MEPDVKRLLEENLSLNRENHELLKKVYRIEKWAHITRIAYWFVIIGVALGAFYFVKPFLGNILDVYTGGVSNVNSIQDIGKSIPDIKSLQQMIKDLNQ